MKALTDRLVFLWVHLLSLPDGSEKTALLDIWIECNAIAEALPELAFKPELELACRDRKPPKPIIRLD